MAFQKDFLWGAASASYQVEGAWDVDGKAPSIWDIYSKIPGKTFEGTNGDVAVDHYHHYKEDVRLMKEMGLKSYRFSIAWSRVLPNGQVNEKGIEFYSNLIDELLANDVIPFITLYHWDLPQYLQDQGGWENKELITEAFKDYAKLCFERFGDRVKHWITFNEMIVFIEQGYITKSHPPDVHDPRRAYQVCHNVNVAHAKAVKLFREMNINGEIGITHVLDPTYPATDSPADIKAAHYGETDTLYWYYDPILLGTYPQDKLDFIAEKWGTLDIPESDLELLKSAKSDFIGVNYYQRKIVKAHDGTIRTDFSRESSTGGSEVISTCARYKKIQPKGLEYTKWGWEIFPQGLYDGMKRIKDRYGDISIYITENGLGDEDLIINGEVVDDPRIDYIQKHLIICNNAIKDGINLKGYYAWSFTDLLSWLNGYKKQYGFVYIDHKNNLARSKKKSYFWYKDVIATNGESLNT